MISFDDYVSTDGVGWAQRVRRKEVLPLELAETAIARAEAINPHINAIAAPLFEEAIKSALRRQEEGPAGPLAGVPFAIKDLFQTVRGAPPTNGSRAFVGHIAQEDSVLVGRYRAAGLNILCTSTAPELGLAATTESTLYGATRNPWELGRTAGGSSGGAAALVAAGVLPAAHATDGGGSIRGPASCCGLFGLKPSRGRAPIAVGRTEGWLGCSTTHAVTRSVRDSAALLDATHGPELGSRYVAPGPTGRFVDAVQRPPGRLRIALHWRAKSGVIPDPECVRAVQSAARLCESLGHDVEEAAPAIDLDAQAEAFGCGVLTAIAVLVDARAAALGVNALDDRLEQVTREYAAYARAFSAVELMQANERFMAASLEMARFQTTYDLILTPTLGAPPIPLGTAHLMQPSELYDAATGRFSCFTAIYNQTGQPAMTVPLHWTSGGLPVGVQFAARVGEEELLFSLAGQLEGAGTWGRTPREAPASTAD